MEDVKQLPPEERVKRLKEIEEERRKEIEEAESLIRDSMREISETETRKHAPIAQVTANDISQLLTAEEKQMFRTARYTEEKKEPRRPGEQKKDTSLEEVAEEEHAKKPDQPKGPVYGSKLDEAKKGLIYEASAAKDSDHPAADYAARISGEEPKDMYHQGGQQAMYDRAREDQDPEKKTKDSYDKAGHWAP
jgi:hypothetical protein